MIRIAIIALVLSGCQSVKAQNYDPDSRWINRTLHKQAHEQHRREEPRRHYRPVSEPRRYYDRNNKPIEHAGHGHPPGESRVYGFIHRQGDQRIERDVLSNVICMPAIESLSVEANTEEGAWKDAQRNWENKVRWRYGERFLSILNAQAIMKRCSRSSGNQSVAGRIAENVGNAFGADGFKHRCEIIAQPCMAPIEIDPNVKGEPKQ